MSKLVCGPAYNLSALPKPVNIIFLLFFFFYFVFYMLLFLSCEQQKQRMMEEDGDEMKKKEKEKGVGMVSSGSGKKGMRCCQADECTADLTDAKQYHKRHKVCELHAKAQIVLLSGTSQRFCQQCSRFHELSEFDETKRSCRRRLAGHNERRRKSLVEPNAECSTQQGTHTRMKDIICGQLDDDIGRIQQDATYKQFQIR